MSEETKKSKSQMLADQPDTKPYIDRDFYDNEGYKAPKDVFGTDIFDKVLNFAADDIDFKTDSVIARKEKGLADYNTFVKNRFRQAVAAQVEYIINNQERLDAFVGLDGGIGTANQSGIREAQIKQTVSMRAIRFLKDTGLLYAGIGINRRDISATDRIPTYGDDPFGED